jgi:hypothetical protein
VLQRKVIALTGHDRSGDGEEFPLAASGGIFFDQVDGVGITVRFDEERVLVPIRAGRAIDKKFTAFSIVHALGYTGNIVAYCYEKGEGIFDSPTTAELAALEGNVLGVVNMTGITGGRFEFWQLANPVGSGVLLKLTAFRTAGVTEHELRRFATDLPLQAPPGVTTVGRKFEDLRLWAASPVGVLTAGQDLGAGDNPQTHEGGVVPLVKVIPGTGDRLVYVGQQGGGIVLPPGEFLVGGPTAAGVSPIGNAIYWRELAQA